MDLMRDAQWEVLPTLWNLVLLARDRVTQNDHDPLVVVLLVLLFFFATAVVEPGKVCVQLSVAATLWIALASLLEQVVGVLLHLAWRAWGEAPSGVAERVVCVISHIVCLVLLTVNPPFLRLGQDRVELEGAQDASEERGKHCVVYLAGMPCGLRVAVAACVVICSSCAFLDHLFEGVDRTCKTPAAGGTDRRAVRGPSWRGSCIPETQVRVLLLPVFVRAQGHPGVAYEAHAVTCTFVQHTTCIDKRQTNPQHQQSSRRPHRAQWCRLRADADERREHGSGDRSAQIVTTR